MFIIYIIYKIYTVLYMKNYIVEEVKKLLNEFTKKYSCHFAFRAIFRRQLILYKTLQTFNKPVEHLLYIIILTNRAIN